MSKDTGDIRVTETKDGFRIDVSGKALKMASSSCGCGCGCDSERKTEQKEEGSCNCQCN